MMKTNPVVHIRLNVPWLRALVGLLIVLQLLDPNKAWMIVLIGFGGLWLLMYLWSRRLARGLRMEREQLYGWLQVGDWLEERFTLINHAGLPAAWVSIEDHSTLPGYSASMGTGIDAASERRWKKRTPCSRRGMYQLGPLTLMTGDIFGLYTVEITYPDTETFVVTPPVITLPFSLRVTAGRRIDEHRFSRLQAEKSTNSIYAREYQSGDSFAKIHWMTTAKQDEPYVRVFENIHASNSWWILLDLDRDVQIGTGDEATDEHGIILAASMADLGLQTGKSVGLIASGEETVIHPARYGFDHRSAILRSLSVIQRGCLSLPGLIEHSQRFLPPHSNAVLITPSARLDWMEKLDQFRSKHITPTVILVGSEQSEHNYHLGKSARILARRAIDNQLVSPELFHTPEARPGSRGEIKWKVTPHGRAIMIRQDEEPG